MSLLELGLSFAEGLALIVSPCILPVLPLVLSGSVEGGRARPFGIILGFVLAFTAFAMASRSLVQALHLDLDIIKYGSLILLAVFGLILLSDTLSARFSRLTQRFAQAGTNLTANARGGFGSGLLIGGLIGLVWTPCAGPILAAVLVQIIRQESDAQAFLQVAAFGFGAGLPMLAIALAGRRLLRRASFFVAHAEAVRKVFGILILLAVALIASGIDPQRFFAREETSLTLPKAGLIQPVPNPYPAPELAGIESWLNSPPLTMQSLKGKVVLVDFWTYSCINCLRTLPYITAWDRKYRDQGLVILGIHAPEFEFEKKRANVEAALAEHGIRYPVALDNRLDAWKAFRNQYWPAHYLIDREGRVVYTHFGEGKYAETENNIRFLLGLDQSAKEASAPVSAMPLTPETYLGRNRMARYAGIPVAVGMPKHYEAAEELAADAWSLEGRWQVGLQKITATQKGATLRLRYRAKDVFLVLGSQRGNAVKVSIRRNGKAIKTLIVDRHTLYPLLQGEAYGSGILDIVAEAPGLEAYAFTFGR